MKMRIMIVEDKIALNNSLKRILQKQGYAVDQAFDGEEALSLIDNQYYDGIILDLTLPKIDGLEVLDKLRAQKNKTSILVLTARNETKEVVRGLKQGADDYLSKPFEVDELLARLEGLIKRTHQVKTKIFVLDNLSLDSEQKLVKRDKKMISLTATEYQILYYLFLNQGKVVSKQQLLTHVWQNEIDVYERIVDTYICFLRKKIDKNFIDQPKLIQTVKGLGYKLDIVQ